MAVRHHNPAWLPISAVAEYLGYAPTTVHRWVRRGWLRASRPALQHYSDTRPRVHGPRYRIYREDLRAFLRQWRAGKIALPPFRSGRTRQ